MKFFFDNNLSKKLVNGLRAFGEDVVHLKENFEEDASDVEILKFVGKHKMGFITRDERVRWNPAEHAAIRDNRVGAFFLGGKNLNAWKIIQQIVRNWPRVKELGETKSPPYAYRIPPNGTKFKKMI